MECERIEKLLSEYIDDLLDLQTKTFVESHLQSCAQCSKSLEELKNIVQELRKLEPVPPPADFTANVHKRLAERSWAMQLFKSMFVPIKIKLPLQFAAAAIVAIIVITLSYKIKPDVEVTTRTPEVMQKERQQEQPFMDKSAPEPEKQDRLSAVASKEEQAEKKQNSRIIEMTLMLKQDIRDFALAERRKGTAMEKAETEESTDVQPLPAPSSLKRKEAKSLIQKNKAIQPRTKKQALKEQGSEDAVAQIKTLATRFGGTVVDIEFYSEPTDKPKTITVKIPSSGYENFLEGLKRTGRLQPIVEVPAQANLMITVRIHLLTSLAPELPYDPG